MSEQILATLYELSRYFRLPCSWLHREAKAGRIPSLRVGRKLLFNIPAVERALAERAAGSRAPRLGSDAKSAPDDEVAPQEEVP